MTQDCNDTVEPIQGAAARRAWRAPRLRTVETDVGAGSFNPTEGTVGGTASFGPVS